jgi:hypothetical protein
VVQTSYPIDLDPAAVFGAFTWDDDDLNTGGEGGARHREIDFCEVSRWGQPWLPTNAQFVVQPAVTVPENLLRVDAVSGAPAFGGGEFAPSSCEDLGPDGFAGQRWTQTTWVTTWAPGGALSFAAFPGLFDPAAPGAAPPAPLATWTFPYPERVPTPGNGPVPGCPFCVPLGARVHFNLWLNNPERAPASGRAAHVVVNDFKFYPLGGGRRALLEADPAVVAAPPPPRATPAPPPCEPFVGAPQPARPINLANPVDKGLLIAAGVAGGFAAAAAAVMVARAVRKRRQWAALATVRAAISPAATPPTSPAQSAALLPANIV